MEITPQINTCSRTKGNEEKKGYYPTFSTDINNILKVLKPSYGWKSRGTSHKNMCIFDPCAGEGHFLHAVTRHFKNEYKKVSDPEPTNIEAYAVELDTDRFKRIKGTSQKLNSSFFDTSATGKFSVILLNPPYNKNCGELVRWVDKAAPMLAHPGVMVLIIPEYELVKPEMQAVINGNFPFSYAFKSEEYEQYKQVVVFLKKDSDNTKTHRQNNYISWPSSNIGPGEERKKYPRARGNRDLCVRPPNSEAKPLLETTDLSEFYEGCGSHLDKVTGVLLDKIYPSCYDTTIKPLSTLRTAHAVQLAAMNSQVESVTINGDYYLAKYMVITKAENFDDPESKTETTVYKPTVEAFLMDRNGIVKTAKEYGFDYYELNSQLSAILLRKLTTMYQPLHEIGQDEAYLADELKEIGLMAPQREAIKAVIKGYKGGRKGIGIRASTGSGKTWLAKAAKYLLAAKRTIMVTEPHLVPQMVEEYKNEGFDVHVIDSWEKLIELCRLRPKGMYIISYTRLRMHPKYEVITRSRKTIVIEQGQSVAKYVEICTSCRRALVEKTRRGDKPKCAYCGDPLYTYVPENNRPHMNYRKWIGQIEANGTAAEVKSHNKQLPYIRYLKKMRFDLAIPDELHNSANLMSNQGTATVRLASAAKKVLGLTATVTNGMAKSMYNILWILNPKQMREAGWDMKSATDFQAKYGAFKEVRKTEANNRHRESERITTYDTAGISPAILIYTLPNFVNVDSEDFDDLPPVEREVIKCASHPLVEKCQQIIEKIIDNADLPPEDKLAANSVRNAAFLRVSDTFRHADDELKLRDCLLGTLRRFQINELLEKEEKLVEVARGVIARGERMLVYTGNTQKIDMRGPIKHVLSKHVSATVEVLPDSVPPEKLVEWFAKVTAQIVVASFHRVATGLNLSEFNNLFWFDYTDNTRKAEQGDGRIRRVNTAAIHRKIFGEVRPVRYWYATSSKFQEMQLSYTLEKRMVAKLAEGETPDIDPAECSSGCQSFSALITKALNEGTFDYQDPSALLKKMTKNENAKVRAENLAAEEPEAPRPQLTNVIELRPAKAEAPQPASESYSVISVENGRETEQSVPADLFEALFAAGELEITLFGVYRSDRPKKTARR